MESTKVQFPRFQRENPEEGPTYKRDMEYVAELRHWMVEPEFRKLITPATNTNGQAITENLKGNWWGMYHSGSEQMSLGLLMDDRPKGLPYEDDPMTLFRYRSIKHDYLWDKQALSGTSYEVILEQLTLDGFVEVMALLANQREGLDRQRLVTLGVDGQMAEPEFVNISRDPKRRFYMETLGALCVATYDDLREPEAA